MPTLRRYIRRFEDETEVVASLNVGDMWQRMLGEFLNEFQRATRQGVTGDELDARMQSYLEGLSDKPVEEMARKTTSVAYSQGRNAALLSAAEQGQLQYVVRSAILDNATCDPCELLDSSVFEVGTGEYQDNMPPAKCDGLDRCRCFYIPVTGGGAA